MSANATAPMVNRVVLERVVDNLDELTELAWNGQDQDRLRELAGEALILATVLLEEAV